MTQIESGATGLNSGSSIDKQIAIFWKNFHLFPSPTEEAIFKNPWLFSAIVLFPFVLRLLISLIADLRDVPFLYNTNYSDSDWAWTYNSFNQWILFVITLCILPAGWAYRRFLTRIPEFFQWLLEGEHIRMRDGSVKQKYLHYLQTYQASLCSRKDQIKFVAIGIAALLIWLLLLSGDLTQCVPFGCSFAFVETEECRMIQSFCRLQTARDLIPYGFGYLLWVILLGSGIWALYASGRQLRILTDTFELVIKTGHTDRCGGLNPIGTFCFDMALPMAIGFVAIALVSIIQALHQPLSRYWPFPVLANEITVALIIIVGFGLLTPLIIFTFFAPLSGIHQAMVQRKREVGDSYANKLEEIERSIWLVVEDESKSAQAKEARERLETFQALDPDRMGYPEWPFRRETVLRLFSPQIAVVAIGLFLDLRDLFPG